MKTIRTAICCLLTVLFSFSAVFWMPSCSHDDPHSSGPSVSNERHRMTPYTIVEKASYINFGRLECSCIDCNYQTYFSTNATKRLSYEEDELGRIYVSGIAESNASFLYISNKTPDGRDVYGIAYNAFMDCETIRYVVVEDGISELEPYAFSGCTSLVSATLPKSVSLFGVGMFMGCTSLEAVALPENLSEIPDHCFDGCVSLYGVHLPGGVTEIGNGAFNLCSSLEKIDLPNNLKNIRIAAFSDCTSLTELRFPEGLEQIYDEAFANCTGLTSLILPEHLKLLKEWAFISCTSLRKIYLPSTIVCIAASNGISPFYQCHKDLVLYTDAPSKPDGWKEDFAVFFPEAETGEKHCLKVVYGVTKDEI